MAIGRCPECGGQVSTHSKSCPHCGCDFKQYVRSLPMHPHDKKMWAIILAGVVLYLIFFGPRSGCSDPATPDAYVGTWTSGFNDTDEHANPVNSAFQIEIRRDKTFEIRRKGRSDKDWSIYSSGTVQMTTITMPPSRESRPAIQLGSVVAAFYGGDLNAQYLDGALRTFK